MKILGGLLLVICIGKLTMFSLLRRAFDETYGVEENGF